MTHEPKPLPVYTAPIAGASNTTTPEEYTNLSTEYTATLTMDQWAMVCAHLINGARNHQDRGLAAHMGLVAQAIEDQLNEQFLAQMRGS